MKNTNIQYIELVSYSSRTHLWQYSPGLHPNVPPISQLQKPPLRLNDLLVSCAKGKDLNVEKEGT